MKKLILLTQSIILIFGIVTATLAQDIRENLFKDLDERIEKAQKEDINIMSPSFYAEAEEIYKKAQNELKKGSNLNDIKSQIAESNSYLDKAFKTAEVGEVTFKDVLRARKDALEVSADQNVPELWTNAADRLREAGEELEGGDVNDAKEVANEAENLFRKAELESIKKSYLVETRKKIEQAQDKDVDDYAPKTFALAKQLVFDTEKALNENRYDMDLPRSLAKQSQYQINHAFYLNKAINEFDDKDMTLEGLILSHELELGKIAAALEIDHKFDNGLTPVADAAVEKVEQLKNSNTTLKENISALEQEMNILKEEMSGLTSEKSELASKMEKLNIIKEKYNKVEKIFSKNEAQVLREENDIIIRMVGLSFDVGKAEIKPEDFGLLTRLQKAIKEFPESNIAIEGHTDSYGSDAANLSLSQKRADAVTQYLLANMDIDRTKISSIGYGESKPIANNETKEGRAKNRRIDLVIKN